jgi:hypothetical protein
MGSNKKSPSTPKPIDPGRKSQREKKQMGSELERSRPTVPHDTRSDADDARGSQEPRRDKNEEN